MMMKYQYLLYVALLLVFSACSRHYYSPALYGNDISYQPKPASFDTAKSAGYVSGGMGANQGSSNNNTVSFFELNLSHAHVFNNVNLAYGGFGFVGAIDNSNQANEKDQPHSFNSKGFAGWGGRMSVNLFTHMGNADFRYLGAEAAYSREYGDYAAYRRSVYQLPGFQSTTRTELVTIGGTSEILWHPASTTNTQYGFRLFVGRTLGNNDYLESSDYYATFQTMPLYVTASYFMQVNHVFGVAELTRNVAPLSGLRVKIGYKF